ncbi:hypothetical protein Ae201684P_013292 [Aphanomyces euteiches]|uniref:Uncharacterized protein n=1 Tax=Aphanomyces euteiches TaxID=100861 RepID=A0A6G0WRZ7_9STRA|nr:hypothetical protein Ae201684_012200 [Aphanomyces euteiches]KAH9096626.1 hypothetical protein Ae201684P_013292 [Aphanomyces euteiches]KAH9139079.1 hypothetical protein AeRB84_016635 [Aphanomyces euteiches]
MKLPLPANYFRCPPLSRQEMEQYRRQAFQHAKDLLEKADTTNPRYRWKRIADEAELEIFRGKDPTHPQKRRSTARI